MAAGGMGLRAGQGTPCFLGLVGRQTNRKTAILGFGGGGGGGGVLMEPPKVAISMESMRTPMNFSRLDPLGMSAFQGTVVWGWFKKPHCGRAPLKNRENTLLGRTWLDTWIGPRVPH